MTEVDFNEDIFRDMVIQEENEVHFRTADIIYPSEQSFPCLLNRVYKYVYPNRKNLDSATLMRFELGNNLEYWFVNRLRKSKNWKVLGSQEQIGHVGHDHTYFIGRRDVRAYNCQLEKTFSIEVKAAIPKLYNSKYYAMNWRYHPKQENLQQGNFYLKDDVKDGLLVYITPFYEIKSYSHYWDPELFDHLLYLGYDVHSSFQHYLKDGILPPPEPQYWGGKVCNYCLYTEECAKRRATT